MPGIRLLDQSPLPPPRRRVTALERAQVADQLRRAHETGTVIELTLDPDERAAAIRLRYQAVARELGYAVRFQTARTRRYRDWQGTERGEAAVLLVHVHADGAAPRGG
jgi:hypothetical protein